MRRFKLFAPCEPPVLKEHGWHTPYFDFVGIDEKPHACFYFDDGNANAPQSEWLTRGLLEVAILAGAGCRVVCTPLTAERLVAAGANPKLVHKVTNNEEFVERTLRLAALFEDRAIQEEAATETLRRVHLSWHGLNS